MHCIAAVAGSSQQHRDAINEKSIKWVKVNSPWKYIWYMYGAVYILFVPGITAFGNAEIV
jgi:hypothetical protein